MKVGRRRRKLPRKMKTHSFNVGLIQKSERRPQHRVVNTEAISRSEQEVTVGQFRQFVEATKYQTEAEKYGFGDDGSDKVMHDKVTDKQKQQNWQTPGHDVTDDFPCRKSRQNDACAFCNWLSEKEQRTPCYRADGTGGGSSLRTGTACIGSPRKRSGNTPRRAGTTT